MLVSTGLSQHPGPVGHRWLMTHVLSVSAGEVRNPIPDFILVVSDDLLVHHDLGGTVHRLWGSVTAAQTDVLPWWWLRETPSDLNDRCQTSR